MINFILSWQPLTGTAKMMQRHQEGQLADLRLSMLRLWARVRVAAELRLGAYGDLPQCEGIARRKFHAVPIIYKGTGFYTTDYKNTGYSGVSKSENEEDGSKEKAKTAKASADSSSDKSEAAKEA